jgi:hypothetical protein
MKKLLLITLLTCFAINTFGQKNITDQSLVWYGVFTKIGINKNWYVQNEFQERHFINPIKQHQFVVRTHVHRKINNNWESSIGMCLFLQNPNDPNSSSNLTVPELRPHFEMAYKQKTKKVEFDHRYRLEARFFHNTNQLVTELEEGFEYSNLRFRYRLQSTIPIYEFSSNKFIKLKVSDEIHFNIGKKIVKNVFEQNRIYVALNIDMSEKANIEVGYMNWFQQRPNGNFFNRNILRFTVFHDL